MNEKSWVHHLFFNPYFEDALTKMKARTGLGSTYALLTALNEYFFREGHMDEKGYLFNKEQYSSRPLVDEFERKLEAQDFKTKLEILKKEQELKELKRRLSDAYAQWDTMNPESRKFHICLAEKSRELEISQKILRLAGVAEASP